MWQQDKTDNESPYHISQHHLQERQIGVVSQARNTDDGESAGFCRNNRKRDRPPGNIPVGEKIIAQGALLLAKAQPKQSDPRQVKRDDAKVKLIQNHKYRVAKASVAAGDSPASG